MILTDIHIFVCFIRNSAFRNIYLQLYILVFVNYHYNYIVLVLVTSLQSQRIPNILFFFQIIIIPAIIIEVIRCSTITSHRALVRALILELLFYFSTYLYKHNYIYYIYINRTKATMILLIREACVVQINMLLINTSHYNVKYMEYTS